MGQIQMGEKGERIMLKLIIKLHKGFNLACKNPKLREMNNGII